MARPKTLSDPIQFRIPLRLWPILLENAEAAGVTPSEWVRRKTIDSIGLDDLAAEPTDAEMAHSEKFILHDPLGRPLDEKALSDTVVPLGPESELVVPEAFQEPTDEELARSQEVKYGPHPSWRLNTIGMNVCTVCGEPKGTARKLCTGNQL